MSEMKAATNDLAVLFDSAEQALSALLEAIQLAGGIPPEDRYLDIALITLKNSRYIHKDWANQKIIVPIAKINEPDILLTIASNQFGVSMQDCIRFEKYITGKHNTDVFLIECNHPGCIQTKDICFSTPASMLAAEYQMSMEIWYCKNHQQVAWEKHRILCDTSHELLLAIERRPGANMTEIGITKKDLEFLQHTGLLAVKTVPRNGKNYSYQLNLSDAGERYIKEHSGRNQTCVKKKSSNGVPPISNVLHDSNAYTLDRLKGWLNLLRERNALIGTFVTQQDSKYYLHLAMRHMKCSEPQDAEFYFPITYRDYFNKNKTVNLVDHYIDNPLPGFDHYRFATFVTDEFFEISAYPATLTPLIEEISTILAGIGYCEKPELSEVFSQFAQALLLTGNNNPVELMETTY